MNGFDNRSHSVIEVSQCIRFDHTYAHLTGFRLEGA